MATGDGPQTGSGLSNGPGYLYLIKELDGAKGVGKYYKIGGSVDPDARLKHLQTSNPRKLELLETFEVGKMKAAETHVHEKILERMKKTELKGGTEWFFRKSSHTTDASIKDFIEKAIEDQ